MRTTSSGKGMIVRRGASALPLAMAVLLLSTMMISAIVLFPVHPAAGATEVPGCDFDGDGFADLAVGAPADGIGTAPEAGVVNVIYGAISGLSRVGDRILSQDSPGIVWIPEEGD